MMEDGLRNMNQERFTDFPGGLRVSKSDALVCAMGSLDELNAALGILRAQLSKGADADVIRSIQGDLLQIGNELATGRPHLDARRISAVESETESRKALLPPQNGFYLFGDEVEPAFFNWARTVCRRAERELVRAQECQPERVTACALRYLNRLSSLLFVLAIEGTK